MVGNLSTSSSKMRFSVKLILFLLLLVALDYGIGSLLRVYYFKQKSGLNYRTTYAISKSTEDFIVIGSSRAKTNYVPSVLEQGLGGTCYNAGRDGQSLLFACAVQKAIVARHKPDAIVLDVILADFYQYHRHYDRLSTLLPYYESFEEVRPTVLLRSPLERVKLISRIYPYNSLVLQILKYNRVEERDDNGHVTQKGEINLPVPPRGNRPWMRNGLDPNMTQTLDSLIESCTESGIRLFVVISPVFDGQVFGKDALEEVASALEGSPFGVWDYSDNPGFVNDPHLFKDRGHLNNVGAKKFSEMIAERVKVTLKAEGISEIPSAMIN